MNVDIVGIQIKLYMVTLQDQLQMCVLKKIGLLLVLKQDIFVKRKKNKNYVKLCKIVGIQQEKNQYVLGVL